jgi:cytochrome c
MRPEQQKSGDTRVIRSVAPARAGTRTSGKASVAASGWTAPGRGLQGRLAAATLLVAGWCLSGTALAANDSAARDLADDSGCFKCHGVDKKKDGPALRDAAAKYRGTPDAEEKLIFHVTSGEKVKFPDGHEEHHKKVKSKDEAEIRNLVRWILSLEGGTKR